MSAANAVATGAKTTGTEANKVATLAFYKQALLEGDVEKAFRTCAGLTYHQHNPLVEDGMEGVRKFVAWITATHPDARCEINAFSRTATTSSCTPTGTACRMIPAAKRSWTSSGSKTASWWSTGM